MADIDEIKKKKLQAEIREIDFKIKAEQNRIESEKEGSLREDLKGWMGIITPIASLSIAVISVWSFLDQRQKEYEFNINKEMIALVNQMSDSTKIKSEHAAVLLSSFEKGAVPILLTNLESTENRQAVIESLTWIKSKKNVDEVEDVIQPLLNRAEKIIHRELSKPPETLNRRPILNYLFAIGELCQDRKQEVITKLEHWKKEISAEDLQIDILNRDDIISFIDAAKKKLKSERKIIHFGE